MQPPPIKPVYSRRFGEPVPGFVTTFCVALLVNALVTAEGVAVGLASR